MISLVLVETIFSWGYILKPPYLALGGKSLPYPSPTTLVGALTYPYMRYRGDAREIIFIDRKPHSPAVNLLDKVKYAVMGYLKPSSIQVVDINKYASYGYLRGTYRERKEMWFSIMGVGKNYTPYKSVIAYLVKREHIEEIGKIAWGITRIGSKEGLVSVKKVTVIREPETITRKRVKTIFPVPARLVKTPMDNYDKIKFWRLCRETYSTIKDPSEYMEDYYVPRHVGGVYGGEMTVELEPDKSTLYNTPYGPLVIPKDIIW